MRRRTILALIIAAAFVVALAIAGVALASPGGITGYSTTGCNGCHNGGTSPTATLTGPTTVTTGSTNTYTLTISGGQRAYGGLDVSATSGTLLSVSGQGTKLQSGEIVQTSAKAADGSGNVAFSFQWTAPGSAGSATLLAAGLSADGNGGTSGDRGALATLAITVSNPVTSLSITTTSLPDGTVNAGYSQTLSATGGTGAYTWSVSTGSLPDGLGLNASTGVISGTPTTAGTSSFTVSVHDSAPTPSNDTQAVSITIGAAATPPPDTTGPVTSSVSISPRPSRKNPVSSVTLTATVNDSTTGGSNIKSATYYVDGVERGAMAAIGASAASSTQNFNATVSLVGLSVGRHTISVTGTDVANNTGAAVTIRFRLAVSSALAAGQVRIARAQTSVDEQIEADEHEVEEPGEENEAIESAETESQDEIVVWIGPGNSTGKHADVEDD